MAIDHLQVGRDRAVKLYRAEMATDPTTAAMVAAASVLDPDIFESALGPISDAGAALTELILRDVERGRPGVAPLMQGPCM